MKTYLWSGLVLSAALLTVGTAQAIEKPAVYSEGMISITVSDLHGFIDAVGGLQPQFSPMSANGEFIKNMVGMQIGDPALSGFAPGKGFAVVAMNPTNIFGVVEVSEAQSGIYSNTVVAQGLQAVFTNGVLLVGNSPQTLGMAIEKTAGVQESLLANRSASLRIAGQPAQMMERNAESIQSALQMMPMMIGMGMMQTPGMDAGLVQSISRLLEGEIRVLLSMAEQCESGEIKISPENGAIQITETVVPKAGTGLANLVNAKKTSKPNPRIQSRLIGEGMVQFDFEISSPDELNTFIAAEVDGLFNEMNITNVHVKGMADTLMKWMQVYNGAGCETASFDAEDGMSANYLLEVSDESKALDMFKDMQTDMAPVVKLYESLGMPLSFEFKENVRQHKGISIHVLAMDIDFAHISTEQLEQFKAMNLDDMKYEIAVFDGLLLYTMGATKIETVIDRVKDESLAVEPIVARTKYPEGGFYYFDFDIGQYVELIAASMPEQSGAQMMPLVAMMQGVDPITGAGFREDGMFSCSLSIPGDLIGKISQYGMMLQMQQMQQQQQMPTDPQAAPAPAE